MFLKNSMNFGAILGLLLTILFIVDYLTNNFFATVMPIMQYATIIIVIIWGTKYLRDSFFDGNIKYARALSSGTAISFYGAVIMAFVTYVFYAFIDPSALEKILIVIEQQLLKNNMSEHEIDLALGVSRKMTTPFFLAMGTIFGLTVWGFVFSLITSIFIKKNNNSGINI